MSEVAGLGLGFGWWRLSTAQSFGVEHCLHFAWSERLKRVGKSDMALKKGL